MKFDRRPLIAHRIKQGPVKSELKAELVRMLKQIRPDKTIFEFPDGSTDYLSLAFHALSLRAYPKT